MSRYARTGGKAIHEEGCRALSRLSSPPCWLTRQQAQDLGFLYQPCRICAPDISTRPKQPIPERQCYHGEWSE